MNPSIDDRLASIIRSLTDIILPALPREAGLAQEQTHLAIGHLKIIRAQLDSVPAFEIEELADTRALAAALLSKAAGGTGTKAAVNTVRTALDQDGGDEHPRQSRIRINRAIDELIRQLAVDGTPEFRAFAADTVIRLQSERALKDRKWFSLMGFDSDILKNGGQ
jgi:hypothetical protein